MCQSHGPEITGLQLFPQNVFEEDLHVVRLISLTCRGDDKQEEGIFEDIPHGIFIASHDGYVNVMPPRGFLGDALGAVLSRA